MRRPSPAVVLALVALFFALDGPAHAAKAIKRISGSRVIDNTITGAKIKNGSLERQDLSARARNSLKVPGNRTVTGAKLAPNAVTSASIRARSVGTDELADGSVESRQVKDGSLRAADVTSRSGQVTVDFPSLPAGQCATRAFNVAGDADISDDVVAATPPSNWPDAISLTPALGPKDGAFRLTACNGTGAVADPGNVNVRFAVFDL
jgi:hypothetical protein